MKWIRAINGNVGFVALSFSVAVGCLVAGDVFSEGMFPRGAGFSERKVVELLMSKLEQHLNLGQGGEVKALLSSRLESTYGGSWEDAAVLVDVFLSEVGDRVIADISLSDVTIKGGTATVDYEIRLARTDQRESIRFLHRSSGQLVFSRSRRSWKIMQCDHLLDVLCACTSLMEEPAAASWVDAVKARKNPVLDPGGR